MLCAWSVFEDWVPKSSWSSEERFLHVFVVACYAPVGSLSHGICYRAGFAIALVVHSVDRYSLP